MFIDSPLNHDGFEQAKELSKFIVDSQEVKTTANVDEVIASLRGSSNSSVIVSSNLRRAISTTTVALWPRIARTGEKIVILSSLQEISRNIDTQALAAAKETPDLSRVGECCKKDDG